MRKQGSKYNPYAVCTKSVGRLNAKSKKSMFKLSKTDKKIVKGVAIGVGVLALVGASGEVAKRFKK